MTLSDWMVPSLSVSAELELENSKRVLRNHAQSHPERVADLACSVMQHSYMQQSILRNATKRIAELEMTILFSESQSPEGTVFVTSEPKSLWELWVLRLLGVQPAAVRCTKT